MFRILKTLTIALLVLSLCASCGGDRVPKAKTARVASISFFKKYGRKFPTTPFGHKNFDNLTINHIEEISYRFALIDAIVTFVDGHAGRVLVRMENKFPGGWRAISWEMLGYQ